MDFSRIEKVLGGDSVLHKRIESHLDMFELSEEGVTKDALSYLAKGLPLTRDWYDRQGFEET